MTIAAWSCFGPQCLRFHLGTCANNLDCALTRLFELEPCSPGSLDRLGAFPGASVAAVLFGMPVHHSKPDWELGGAVGRVSRSGRRFFRTSKVSIQNLYENSCSLWFVPLKSHQGCSLVLDSMIKLAQIKKLIGIDFCDQKQLIGF
jgi:hypothetical protein